MIARIACAAAFGTAVTLLLLFLMQALLRFDAPGATPQREPFFQLATVRIKPDPPVKEELNRFEQLKQRVNPAPSRPGLPAQKVWNPVLPPGVLPPPPVIEAAVKPAGEYDTPLVTLMLVEAVYPARASEQGLEGFATVRFDVQANGRAVNAAVIDASQPLFARSALEALARSRFQARVVGGVPQPSYGLQKRFVFRMERG